MSYIIKQFSAVNLSYDVLHLFSVLIPEGHVYKSLLLHMLVCCSHLPYREIIVHVCYDFWNTSCLNLHSLSFALRVQLLNLTYSSLTVFTNRVK